MEITNTVKEGHARFHGKGGYENQQKTALLILDVGTEYEIVGGAIYDWSTDLKLRGVDGSWNSALFDVDIHAAPLEHLYRRG